MDGKPEDLRIGAPTRSAHGSERATERLHRRQPPLSRWRKIERQRGILFRLPMGALALRVRANKKLEFARAVKKKPLS